MSDTTTDAPTEFIFPPEGEGDYTTTDAPTEFIFPPEGEGDYTPPDASCPTARARYDDWYRNSK